MIELVKYIYYPRKNFLLLDNLKINLLTYESNHVTNAFLDSLYTNSFLTNIEHPTYGRLHSRKVSGDIFFHEVHETIN